jgi:hypothetical protein
LPLIAAVTYFLLSIRPVQEIFADWIPAYYYRISAIALLILLAVFISCRIMDIVFCSNCHYQTCTVTTFNDETNSKDCYKSDCKSDTNTDICNICDKPNSNSNNYHILNPDNNSSDSCLTHRKIKTSESNARNESNAGNESNAHCESNAYCESNAHIESNAHSESNDHSVKINLENVNIDMLENNSHSENVNINMLENNSHSENVNINMLEPNSQTENDNIDMPEDNSHSETDNIDVPENNDNIETSYLSDISGN